VGSAVGDSLDNPVPHEPHRLAQLLSRAEHALRRRVATVLDLEGCSVEQWRALTLLADGHSRTMSEIAEFALLPAPSLTRLVDRMVADNLVYRRADPADRRRVLVRITPRGAELYRQLLAQLSGDEVFADIGADVAQLADLLNAVIARLNEP
jgi:DNA-binding MarR family transcriptional regulator